MTSRLTKLVSLLRCGGCRYAAFYFVAFYVPFVATGRGSWRWVLFSAIFWFFQSLAIELTNRLSDQVEDRINRPERTQLCEQIGFRRIKTIVSLIWLALMLVWIGWIALERNLILGFNLCMGFLTALNYSYGLRLKARKYLMGFGMIVTFGGPFVTGWSTAYMNFRVAGALDDLIHHVAPFLLVVDLFILSVAGIKDITDRKGDEQIGYRGLLVSLVTRGSVVVVLLLLLFPFLVTYLLIHLAILPARFLYLLAVLPVSLLLNLLLFLGHEDRQRRAVRELTYYYWLAFISLALFLYDSTRTTELSILGSWAYWILASQYLHWSGGLRMNTLRDLAGIFSRQRAGHLTSTHLQA
jgi:4-hydroxybenzoate polyprenyltransferase